MTGMRSTLRQLDFKSEVGQVLIYKIYYFKIDAKRVELLKDIQGRLEN